MGCAHRSFGCCINISHMFKKLLLGAPCNPRLKLAFGNVPVPTTLGRNFESHLPEETTHLKLCVFM